MTVTKASIRRPAELVFMGAKGRNTSQVSFPNIPTERKGKTHLELLIMQSGLKKLYKKLFLCISFGPIKKAIMATYCQTGGQSVGCLYPGNAE